MTWLDSITDSMDMNLSKLREVVRDRGDWPAVAHTAAQSWTRLSDCKTTANTISAFCPNIFLFLMICGRFNILSWI